MPEWLTFIINKTWVQITAAAGAVALIAGLIGNIDKLSERWEKHVKARRERKELPAKTFEAVRQMQADYACLSGTVREQQKTLGQLIENVDGLQKQNTEQSQSINELKDSIKTVDADTGDILCSQLTREHDYYMERGYCPSADKRRVSSIYQSYKERGRNHLAERFFDDVLSLPEHL